jgi:hypothetical protein
MLELEVVYLEDQEIFDQFETDRVAKVRENQEKEYNNSKMALDRLNADVTAIIKEQTANQASIDASAA